jgi:hypothetical protein
METASTLAGNSHRRVRIQIARHHDHWGGAGSRFVGYGRISESEDARPDRAGSDQRIARRWASGNGPLLVSRCIGAAWDVRSTSVTARQ